MSTFSSPPNGPIPIRVEPTMAEIPAEQSVMAVIRAARPTFRNADDKVAFVVHATFFAAGFVLRATGPAAFEFCSNYNHEVGIDGWNQLERNYGFVYTHPNYEGFQKIVVKCLALGGKLNIIAGLQEGSDYPDVLGQLRINVRDYVLESNAGSNDDDDNENEDNYKYNYSSMFNNDFGKLVGYVDDELVSKFIGRRRTGFGFPSYSLIRAPPGFLHLPPVWASTPRTPSVFPPSPYAPSRSRTLDSQTDAPDYSQLSGRYS